MSDKQGLHEDFNRDDDIRAGSERAFGIVFAVVFTIIGLWPLLDGEPFRVWALAIAGIFLSAGLLLPVVLKPLNRAWFLFGQVLHKIVNPLIMGLLFFLTITPIALMMRVVGKDPLQRKFDPDAETYWIKRDPPGPAPDSMRQQF